MSKTTLSCLECVFRLYVHILWYEHLMLILFTAKTCPFRPIPIPRKIPFEGKGVTRTNDCDTQIDDSMRNLKLSDDQQLGQNSEIQRYTI